MILDEVIDVINVTQNINSADVKHLISTEMISIDDNTGEVTWIAKKDDPGRYSDIRRLAEAHTLVHATGYLLNWLMPLNTFRKIPKLTILTFMFMGSTMYYYFNQLGLMWTTWYIEDGKEKEGIQDLSIVKDQIFSKIHVYEGKLNNDNDRVFSLSSTWWGNPHKDHKTVLNNAYNFFRHQHSAKGNDAGWCNYKKYDSSLNGYQRSFIPFNARATNKYGKRHYAAYLVNLHMNPGIVQWFRSIPGGQLEVNEDMYALSNMLQWIWRFAIRNGEDTYLYLPSKRMRDLFYDWQVGNDFGTLLK